MPVVMRERVAKSARERKAYGWKRERPMREDGVVPERGAKR